MCQQIVSRLLGKMERPIQKVIIRSYLKSVFWSNLCVGSSFQFLDIPQYACGLKLGPALTLNQNPIFEMTSTNMRSPL